MFETIVRAKYDESEWSYLLDRFTKSAYIILVDRRYCMSAENNYAFFLKHLDELIKTHPNEYVVVADEKFVFFHPTFEGALNYGMEKFGAGNFIVQCCADPGANSVVFHSRVLVKG